MCAGLCTGNDLPGVIQQFKKEHRTDERLFVDVDIMRSRKF